MKIKFNKIAISFFLIILFIANNFIFTLAKEEIQNNNFQINFLSNEEIKQNLLEIGFEFVDGVEFDVQNLIYEIFNPEQIISNLEAKNILNFNNSNFNSRFSMMCCDWMNIVTNTAPVFTIINGQVVVIGWITYRICSSCGAGW